VLGYTRMLRSGKLETERQERAIDVIERNATVLHQLVSDVLDVSGIVTGKIRINLVLCDLAVIVKAACDSVRPTADAKGVEVFVHSPASPVMVRCDADRLQQVLWNLLTNAVKFTPRDGRVSVEVDRTDRFATVTVKDSGIGIKPEALPHVFQRFWQGDSVNSRLTSGLGLGLALARHFVELHGGTITAESDGLGKGATFTVTFPLTTD
jgi:signal transduction histidine kinase